MLFDVRTSPAEYLALDLRVHTLLRHVPLYDVSVVDVPGGGPGRSLADVRALDAAAPPDRIEATMELAKSQNAKVIVVGNAKNGLPLIYSGDR